MYPFSLRTHDDNDLGPASTQRQQRVVRKSKSYAVIGQLAGIVRDPVGSLGYALGTQWQQDAEEARRKEEALKRANDELRAQVQILAARMKDADSYADWHAAAAALDTLEGHDAWKADGHDSRYPAEFYNPTLITQRLNALDKARLDRDAKQMMFLIRTALSRNLGGMTNLKLYRHSHVGTKYLIEKYIESAVATLKALLEVCGALPQTIPTRSGRGPEEQIDPRIVLEQLLAARQAFGRSALLLSGGGTFGMNHIGVVKCLWEEKLLPRIMSGSSAGSIVAGVLCTKIDEEIPAMLEYMLNGDLAVFEDPDEAAREGLLGHLRRFLTHGAIYENKHLIRVLKHIMGDLTFQEAYNRTRRILNICVSSASIFELPRLLNYVTAPNVIIWSAVSTSCSVPFIFTPSSLLAKDPTTGDHVPWNGASPSLTTQRWIDGSVDNDLPMTRLAEMFNVNHFIVSQVNPHVVPFLKGIEGAEAEALTTDGGQTRSWLNTAATLAKGELVHRMHILADMHILPTTMSKCRSILNQKYSGDITILPEIPLSQFPLVLTNPTPSFMFGAMCAGARATWPKLSRIRNALSIEMALDDAVGQARGRVVFSKSQVDQRLDTFHRTVTDTARGRRSSRRTHELWRHSASAMFDVVDHEVHKPIATATKPAKAPQRRKAPGRISLPKLKVTRDSIVSSSSATEGDFDSQSTRKHSNIFALSSSPLSSPIDSSTELDESDDSDVADFYDMGPRTAIPELWPSTRQIFPSAARPQSQPQSPYRTSQSPARNSAQSISSTLTMTPASPGLLRKSSTIANIPPASLAPTPPKQSEPERRYKRLFHKRFSKASSSQDISPPITSPTRAHAGHTPRASMISLSMAAVEQAHAAATGRSSPARSRRQSMERSPSYVDSIPLDISGTRGMLLRKKSHRNRRGSTGTKGVMPPGAR